MISPSFIQRVTKVHPAIILPAVGAAAWFTAGLVPGNGTTPAQAMPERGAARSAPRASIGALPDRLPDSLAALSAPTVSPAASAYAPVSGSSLGPSGGSAGDSPPGGGNPSKRAAQAGQAGATQPDHAHRREGLAGLHPRPGQPLHQQIAPTASPHPRMAPRMTYVAPVAPPPRVMASAALSPFPFFGGGHFAPRANFGGGHFNGGGGRHR